MHLQNPLESSFAKCSHGVLKPRSLSYSPCSLCQSAFVAPVKKQVIEVTCNSIDDSFDDSMDESFEDVAEVEQPVEEVFEEVA